MGSVSKHQKTIDRISNLPTNLIGYILSFLPTKDAVRTSVLSTHWTQQWELITHLDFDDSSVTNVLTSQAKFVHFVYRVLLIKVRQLELFRLKCHRDYGVNHVNSWLFAVLSRNTRKIDLWVPIYNGSHLQNDCLFSSRILVVLKLGKGFLLRVPTLISLVSLKVLHFRSVEFEDSESLSRLISSCPVLEEFKMKRRLSRRVNVINISSLSLKRLILIKLCIHSFDLERQISYKVVLNTPSLEYLETNDTLPDGYHIENLPCLDRARLSLDLAEELYVTSPMLVYPMDDLAVAISNVRFLYLSDYTLENFRLPKLTKGRWPKFPRLTELEIGSSDTDSQLYELEELLESTPQLASLSFELTNKTESWELDTNVPFCMQYNLTVIKVNFVHELKMENLDILKSFLNKTYCLKEVIISGMMEQKAKVIKDVLMFPRASKLCKIVLN